MRSASFSSNGFVRHVYKWLHSAAHSMKMFLNSFVSRLQNWGADGPATINRHLLLHEEPVISVRQHPASLIGPSALALVGLLAAIVLTIFLYDSGALVLAVWVAWLLLFLRLVLKTINWIGNYFVVTSDRMLFVTGMLVREVSMIPIWTATDLTFSRSLGGRLFGYGEFIIEYGGQDRMMLNGINFIPNPEQHYLRICQMLFQPNEVETISCPICNGEGRIFRHAYDKVEMPDHAGDHPAGNLGQDKEDLLARGYEEASCPKCGGEGTVSASSGS